MSAATTHAANEPTFPAWQIGKICADDSARGQCQLFEQRARDALNGAWYFIVPAHRAACLAEVKPPIEPSFRVLSTCIDAKASEEKLRVHQAQQLASRQAAEEAYARKQAALAEAEAKKKAEAAAIAQAKADEARRVQELPA
ncbi:MAG: hypothetical protein AAFO62_04365, partial [Pseudomonadota bacterium]